MSVLKSIIKRWNKNTEIYDTLHPETEHAQVVDFGEGTVMHLLATTLANTVEAVSTDSLFGKLVSKLLDATGVQYNFSNSSAWYICFGSLLGGLIIQGGSVSTVADDSSGKTIPFPITFTDVGSAFMATLGQPSTLPNTYSILTNVGKTAAVVWVTGSNGWRASTVRWVVFGW